MFKGLRAATRSTVFTHWNVDVLPTVGWRQNRHNADSICSLSFRHQRPFSADLAILSQVSTARVALIGLSVIERAILRNRMPPIGSPL